MKNEVVKNLQVTDVEISYLEEAILDLACANYLYETREQKHERSQVTKKLLDTLMKLKRK